MKFILSMIICSSVYNSCLPPVDMADLYNSHYECMIAGYNESIKKAEETGPEEVNKYGTIIKFMCIDQALILRKPKPGGSNV